MKKEIKLPKPVYIRAINARDADVFQSSFAPDAVVQDVGREICGIVAIRQWADQEIFAVNVPLDVMDVDKRDGQTIITVRIDGTFDHTGLPDPLLMDHFFIVAADQISVLTCRLPRKQISQAALDAERRQAMSYSISNLLTRNLHNVFGENDPARRRAAIDEIYTEDGVFYDPTSGVYRGRDEIDRIAGVIRATHPDFRYQPIAAPEELGNGGRVQWVSGRPGEAPTYAGTDFIIARDGRIAAVYLFFDKLP